MSYIQCFTRCAVTASRRERKGAKTLIACKHLSRMSAAEVLPCMCVAATVQPQTSELILIEPMRNAPAQQPPSVLSRHIPAECGSPWKHLTHPRYITLLISTVPAAGSSSAASLERFTPPLPITLSCLPLDRAVLRSRPTALVVRYGGHLAAIGKRCVFRVSIMQRIPLALQRLRLAAVHPQSAALMSLTQLAASAWPADLQQHSGGCWQHLPSSRVGIACFLHVCDALHTFTDTVYMQVFSCSSHVQGLQDFFDAPRKEKEEVTSGQLLILKTDQPSLSC